MLSDPKLLGPGLWINIHLKAKKAVDVSSKKDFIDDMYFYYNEFPCMSCRSHIQNYMNTHPFEPFYNMINNGRDIGMFKWAWMFHNAVNTRLQKPYLDWETACDMYDIYENTIEPCTNCGESLDKTKIVQGYFLNKRI